MDELWSQLPDELGGSQDTLVVLGAEPALPLPTPLFCAGGSGIVPLQDQLCMPPGLSVGDGALVVYSDGSLLGSGSPDCQGGAGFVVLEGDKPLWEVAVKLGGWMSSTKMEVYACMAALTILPVSQPVQIFTDSQGSLLGSNPLLLIVFYTPSGSCFAIGSIGNGVLCNR